MEVLLAIAVALIVKGCIDEFSAANASHQCEDLPTVYEPPRPDDDWFRAESARTEAEIAYLVKQAELQETRDWLARRNR